MRHTRRNVLGYSAAIAAASSTAFAQDAPLLLKTIPSSGETLPAIGVGTNRYGVGTAEEERAPLKATLRRFHELGGRVVDTAAVYGTSESVIGDLVTELEIRRGLFLATKTDLRGQLAGQPGLIERFQRLKTEVVDLMQVHNLVNLNEELAVMREWKQAGRIRYLGATISTANQFDQIERAMNDHAVLDFVQFNYSLGDRRAAERLLPTAADRGLGVLINVPFGSGECVTQTIISRRHAAISRTRNCDAGRKCSSTRWLNRNGDLRAGRRAASTVLYRKRSARCLSLETRRG
jgi:aryl-alcohol dehydrogenase-like predicted oxidoreductase